MRIHLITPTPHRPVGPGWEPDAYCGKAWRLCKILTGLGHDVVFYGASDDHVDATHVTVISADERAGWFGEHDWDVEVFNTFDPSHPSWQTVNDRTMFKLGHLLGPTDLIGLTMGTAQSPIKDAFPNHVVAEVGVGYEGVIPGTHRCYESHAWQHYIWGRAGVTDGRWFDCVIPNSFDPADLEFSADKDPYLLYMGRMIPRKGLEVVAELAEQHTVITAGPGDERIPGALHVGVVKGAEKARLLARARAVFVPTCYIEPFGGVAVEAMLSGTPVITSPFGAFSETVADGISGYKCHTLDQFIRAVDTLDDLDPKTVHEWAHDRFTTAAVAPQYERWLNRIRTLYGRGWYA